MRYKQKYGDKRVHVLVWIEHNVPVPKGKVVDHINGDKLETREELHGTFGRTG